MQEKIAAKSTLTQERLPEIVREQIRAAYTELQQKMPEFYERFQQRKMIGKVASVLSGQNSARSILIVEGPTGTGKTLAYLLAAIPLAHYLEKKLVISSATVALQEQLVLQDLPLISQHSGLEFSMQIAKGRGRYACVTKMRGISGEFDQSEFNFANAFWDNPPARHDIASIKEAFRLFKDGKWNGDLDLLPIPFKKNLWSKINNTFHGCTGSRCQEYRKCVFYKERRKAAGADVIIANHDLVLADIAGGGSVLPSIDDSLYVFDEAHHLPTKAISHFAAHASLLGSVEWLRKVGSVFNRTINSGVMDKAQDKAQELGLELADDMRELHSLMQTLPLAAELGTKEHVRFAFGISNQEILEYGEQKIWQPLKQLYGTLMNALELSRQDFDQAGSDHLAKEQQMSNLGFIFGRVENLHRLWQALLSFDKDGSPPYARWITQSDNDFILNVSPISAAEHLRQILWDNAYGAVLTSATLTALNSFARFDERIGLDTHIAEYLRLPSPFDLKRVTLEVTQMRQSPKDYWAHTNEIIRLAPELLSKTPGSLFLFSSRRQMQDIFDRLALEIRQQILVQGNNSKQELLNRHKTRISDGLPSTIFGLDSFAEGLDLPGKLCEHVIIAKLPFAVPTSPVEQATSEYVESRGKNYFFSVSVPDASIKLIQACGRLMRSENDKGFITILDNRLRTTGYGKVLLDSLPSYATNLK